MVTDFKSRMQYRIGEALNRWRLISLTNRVARFSKPNRATAPVVFFNASARLDNLSLNSAFSLLSAWGLRIAGVPVIHFVCQAGMSRCVLGTDHQEHAKPPPCVACVAHSRRTYRRADVEWFSYQEDLELAAGLQGLDLPALSEFEYQGYALGEIVLPSLRWAMRRHHLEDEHPTRFLMRQYMLSAYRVGQEFEAFLNEQQPSAVVLFNGIMFPEAMAGLVAAKHGIPAITHEVSFQPLSGFFTHGQATAYPLAIPKDFELTEDQNTQLDAYLEKRFKGDFSMAGIRFWPEMRDLDPTLQEKISNYDQVVPVFTNVIFDTSQVHSNTLFPHMFAWLDLVLEIIRDHPQTLFVIRAHPDEMRPGKRSRESVQDWVQKHDLTQLPNVVFISSEEYFSSYAMIQEAKFVMVYNSSIGLEAALMGAAVLAGGKSRYSPFSTVYFPDSSQAYRQRAEEFLDAQKIIVPKEHKANARRFLHYQLHKASLLFGDFIKPGFLPGRVDFKQVPLARFKPENNPAMRVIQAGIMKGEEFLI